LHRFGTKVGNFNPTELLPPVSDGDEVIDFNYWDSGSKFIISFKFSSLLNPKIKNKNK